MGQLVSDLIPRSRFKDDTPEVIFQVLGYLFTLYIVLVCYLVVKEMIIPRLKNIVEDYKKELNNEKED